MQIPTSGAARAFLLVALPLSAVAACAQGARSSVSMMDQQGNFRTYDTSGDENRSSVTTFENGVPNIRYTSPPVIGGGIQQPQSIAGLIANQNLYGQSAPNLALGNFTRFGFYNAPVFPPGYNFGFPAPGFGFPAPGIGFPAPGFGYPIPEYPSRTQYGNSAQPWVIPNSVTSIPLGTSYTFPVPAYGYSVPSYPYPYGYGYGNGYGNGTFSSNTANYGVSFGRGGFSASIGGSNTSSSSRSTTTITTTNR